MQLFHVCPPFQGNLGRNAHVLAICANLPILPKELVVQLTTTAQANFELKSQILRLRVSLEWCLHVYPFCMVHGGKMKQTIHMVAHLSHVFNAVGQKKCSQDWSLALNAGLFLAGSRWGMRAKVRYCSSCKYTTSHAGYLASIFQHGVLCSNQVWISPEIFLQHVFRDLCKCMRSLCVAECGHHIQMPLLLCVLRSLFKASAQCLVDRAVQKPSWLSFDRRMQILCGDMIRQLA